MSEELSGKGPADEFGSLEPDEVEAMEDELEEKRYLASLAEDTQKNYAMLRKLRPVTDSHSIAVIELVGPSGRGDYFEALDGMAQFKEWKVVEGAQVQARESSDKEDAHGYVVVRPQDDREHDIYIRVWDGLPNSAVIMPRSDDPLPHHGRLKDEIMEKMELVSEVEKLKEYMIWLKRMREAK